MRSTTYAEMRDGVNVAVVARFHRWRVPDHQRVASVSAPLVCARSPGRCHRIQPNCQSAVITEVTRFNACCDKQATQSQTPAWSAIKVSGAA